MLSYFKKKCIASKFNKSHRHLLIVNIFQRQLSKSLHFLVYIGIKKGKINVRSNIHETKEKREDFVGAVLLESNCYSNSN